MDDTDVAHLAGVWDGTGTITVRVGKNDRYRLGYQFSPLIEAYIPSHQEALLGKFDAYCETQGVNVKFNEKPNEQSSTTAIQIVKHDSIERFLEPLMPWLVGQQWPATILLEGLLPELEAGTHKTKNGFVELMELADELRASNRQGPEPKYDQEYFEEEWGIEATTEAD